MNTLLKSCGYSKNKIQTVTRWTAVLVLSWISINSVAEDAIGSGSFPALMEADPELANHTVYRPQDLSALQNTQLPIVAFGNGGCMNAGSMYRNFLTELSSHGFLVIANGPIGFDLSAPQPPRTEGAEQRPARPERSANSEAPRFPSSAAQLIEAIDWAIAENSRKGSQYYGKLDTNRVAVMGQSCGGLQAMEAASDKRIDTLVLLNSGIVGTGDRMMGFNLSKEGLKDLRGPIGYFTGGKSDGATANTTDDLNYVKAPLFYGTMEVGHMATYAQPNGGAFAVGPVNWLKWQLKDDAKAKAMFVGNDCGLCTNAEWTVVERRGLQ